MKSAGFPLKPWRCMVGPFTLIVPRVSFCMMWTWSTLAFLMLRAPQKRHR